jgi:hypothetical protein
MASWTRHALQEDRDLPGLCDGEARLSNLLARLAVWSSDASEGYGVGRNEQGADERHQQGVSCAEQYVVTCLLSLPLLADLYLLLSLSRKGSGGGSVGRIPVRQGGQCREGSPQASRSSRSELQAQSPAHLLVLREGCLQPGRRLPVPSRAADGERDEPSDHQGSLCVAAFSLATTPFFPLAHYPFLRRSRFE